MRVKEWRDAAQVVQDIEFVAVALSGRWTRKWQLLEWNRVGQE